MRVIRGTGAGQIQIVSNPSTDISTADLRDEIRDIRDLLFAQALMFQEAFLLSSFDDYLSMARDDRKT